jgi:ribonuclease VapC
MIIDSSVLVAIVLEEPDFRNYVDRISKATKRRVSAATLLETCIVVNREKGAVGLEILRRFIADTGIKVVDFTEAHAEIAFDAHLRFGKGMGHPAQLNILDCCTYALAADSGEPLLFKGSDFAKTDLKTAN